ncbi:hypothetical protein Ddye_014718 [Dipteronia dyeriana]|uniref:Uncharacterized protein n=1 Tax=Dipteronia dyeriana TaxID=168575 RepID=A0AAD9X8U2_9ROSI|nr:hypothetical protein Ddye_014718 [Dipteronia dyeriana]
MMAINKRIPLLLCLSCCFFFISPSYSDSNTLEQSRQLEDGQHLVSADETFKLGFFSPGTSKYRYLGIWYNIPGFDNKKVVWVANRNIPIFEKSGVLMIDEFGKLKISVNGGSTSIALSSVQSKNINASATPLDSGNFVIKVVDLDGSTGRILWQSFDYPTNTLLPGMKLGGRMKPDHMWSLTSWISESIPAEGSFSLTIGVIINGSSQLIIWWKRSVYWTSGVWQDGQFELVPVLSKEGQGYKNFSYISNDDEKYFTYSINGNHTLLARYMLDSRGAIEESTGLAPIGACSYKFDMGCVGQISPNCQNKNDRFELRKGFMSVQAVRFDGSYNLSLFDCEAKCWNNCSCRAYDFFINGSQTGCEIWSEETGFAEYNNGREIYFLNHFLNHSNNAKWWIWLVIAVPGSVAVLVFCFLFYFIQRRRLEEQDHENEHEMRLYELESSTTKEQKRDGKKGKELQVFSFESLASATNKFASKNTR